MVCAISFKSLLLMSSAWNPIFLGGGLFAILSLFILILFIKYKIAYKKELKKNPPIRIYPYTPPPPEGRLETEILATDENFAEKMYILNCLQEFNRKYPIRLTIDDEEIVEMRNLFLGYYDANNNIIRDLAGCTVRIMRLMGLPENKVLIKNYLNEHDFPKHDAAAFVSLPSDNMPLFGSPEFNKLTVPIHFRNSITAKFETFVYVIAHELSHIVLHSTKNPLRNSEIATDLFVMNRGFSDVMAKGRKHFKITWTQETLYSIDKFGYLSDSNFEMAQKYIKQLYFRN